MKYSDFLKNSQKKWIKDNTTNTVNSRVDVYLVKNYKYSQFYTRHHIKIHQVMTH